LGDKSSWQYDSSITIRIDKTFRDKLQREADAKGMALSDYCRYLLEGCQFEELITRLPEDLQQKVYRYTDGINKKGIELVYHVFVNALVWMARDSRSGLK